MQDDPATAKRLELERTFNATPEELWAAWTDPEQFAKWHNPAPGFDVLVHEFDVRPGGKIRFDMPRPDGGVSPVEGVFHVLDPYDKIVQGAPDEAFLITTRFEPVGKKTRMTVEVTGVPPEYHEMAVTGWNQGFDKLAGVLGRMQGAIVVVRTIDAPRERVWQAWTDPEEIKRWYGPERFTVPRFDSDLKAGGKYLYCMRAPDGSEMWGTGTYTDVSPPERLVRTEMVADAEGNLVDVPGAHPEGSRVTVDLEEIDGKTRMTMRHDRIPASHLEGATMGWHGAIEKLEKIVSEV